MAMDPSNCTTVVTDTVNSHMNQHTGNGFNRSTPSQPGGATTGSMGTGGGLNGANQTRPVPNPTTGTPNGWNGGSVGPARGAAVAGDVAGEISAAVAGAQTYAKLRGQF